MLVFTRLFQFHIKGKIKKGNKVLNYKKFGLTFLQIVAGCCSGVLVFIILLNLVNFLWLGIQQVNFGGFLTAIFLLISFLIVYFGTVVATAEVVRQIGRLLRRVDPSMKPVPLRKIYEGSFLGLCAAVAILSVTRGDWNGTLQEWGEPIRAIGKVLYVFVVPVKFLTFGFSENLANPSALLFLIISAPIGAVISYNLKPSTKKDEGKNESKDNSEKKDKKDKQ
jgi:hypothetical protein